MVILAKVVYIILLPILLVLDYLSRFITDTSVFRRVLNCFLGQLLTAAGRRDSGYQHLERALMGHFPDSLDGCAYYYAWLLAQESKYVRVKELYLYLCERDEEDVSAPSGPIHREIGSWLRHHHLTAGKSWPPEADP